MSTSAVAWAMKQDTGYSEAKLALIMMAEQAGGDGHRSVWYGTPTTLAAACEMDERDASWSLWVLEETRLVERRGEVHGQQIWLLNVGGSPHLERPTAPLGSSGRQKGAPISKAKRRRIYERDGYRCVICGATEDLTIDHIVPRVAGGGNDETNLQTMCRSCNCRKGARV